MSSEDVGSGVQQRGRTTSSPVFITAERDAPRRAAQCSAAQRTARRGGDVDAVTSDLHDVVRALAAARRHRPPVRHTRP